MGFNLGSFAAGAAQAGSKDIEARRASALELKMRSSLIAQQAQASMQENTQKEELATGAEREKYQRENMLSPEESDTVKKNLAEGIEIGGSKFGGLDMSAMGDKPLSRDTAKTLMELRNSKMTSHAYSAQIGKDPVLDPTTGIITGYQPRGIFGPMGKPEQLAGSGDKVKQGIELINASKDLSQAKEMMGKINFGRLQGFVNNASAYVGTNPDIVNFNSLRTYIATEMPKVLAGFTRFNEPEFNRLIQTIPSSHATPTEVKNWMETYDRVIGGRMTTLGMNPGLFGVVGNLKDAPQAPQDKTGGLTAADFAAEDARRAALRAKKQ